MVIQGPLGAGLGVAARPHADIHRVDRLAAGQGMLTEQCFQTWRADLADRQSVVEAAPAALMLGLHAEQR